MLVDVLGGIEFVIGIKGFVVAMTLAVPVRSRVSVRYCRLNRWRKVKLEPLILKPEFWLDEVPMERLMAESFWSTELAEDEEFGVVDWRVTLGRKTKELLLSIFPSMLK